MKNGKKSIILNGNRCLTIKTKKEMKKNLFVVAAAALMALVSCNKEELGNNSNGVVFVAELEQDASTKTTLGTDRKAHWEVNDQIKINGTVFTANEVGPESSFTTTAENFDVTATPFRAVYPASSYINTAAVEIPANQDGKFASASIAVAESSDQYLKFQNLSSILKFQVPVACSEVKIESSASLAGRITVNYSDGVMTPDYSGVTQPNKTIKVTGSFVPETDYYVAVKPCPVSDGGTVLEDKKHKFTVYIDGKLSKASEKSVIVERTKIHNLGVLPEPATKLSRNLKFSATEVTGYTSGWVVLPTLSGETSGVTYISSDPSVASVESQSGKLSITEKKGTTIITASAPETDKYLADAVSYTLTVNQSNVRIYVRLWPKINGWDKWKNDPYIYYWGGLSSNSFPGNKLKYEKNNDQYDYYYEFEFSRTKKINFVVTCNQGEQSFDVNNITLDKNYYFSVYTEWHDGGKLTINQDSTTNP